MCWYSVMVKRGISFERKQINLAPLFHIFGYGNNFYNHSNRCICPPFLVVLAKHWTPFFSAYPKVKLDGYIGQRRSMTGY